MIACKEYKIVATGLLTSFQSLFRPYNQHVQFPLTFYTSTEHIVFVLARVCRRNIHVHYMMRHTFISVCWDARLGFDAGTYSYLVLLTWELQSDWCIFSSGVRFGFTAKGSRVLLEFR